MLFKEITKAASSKRRAPSVFFHAALLALFVTRLPTASATKWYIPGQMEKVAVIVDIEFTMTLTASKDGIVEDTVMLTDGDVFKAQLPPGVVVSNIKMVEFQFGGVQGKSSDLDYSFVVIGEPAINVLIRNFYMTPAKVFQNVQSKLTDLKFNPTSGRRVDLGAAKKSYLCNKTETISFEKEDKDMKDGYEYKVKLEVTHFQVQAWNIQDREFSPEPPTVCKDVSPPSDNSSNTKKVAIIAASVAGGVVLLAVIAIAIVLIMRRKRNGYSEHKSINV